MHEALGNTLDGPDRRRRGRTTLALLGALSVCAATQAARATTLISEVMYDAVGSDDGQSFVEIWGATGTSLDGMTLEGVNGANGSVGPVVELFGEIPEGGLFVVADMDSEGFSLVVGADQLANFDFQNGPDSIELRLGGEVLDAVGYGDFSGGEIFAGEGAPALDVAPGSSLARVFANVDTDDNAFDFEELALPTPGEAPLAAVPEPDQAALVMMGLGLMTALRRRRER